jgi:CheY-like chemotaxis protein/HPt (histidine-containing phosphotransfer) domain-containing protein
VALSKRKAQIDEAETLLTAIRGGVLVHLQDGVSPEHLRSPLDSARSLSHCATQIGDDSIATSAETLEAWLMLLASESGRISDTRTRSLLDQISELEVALIAFKARSNTAPLSVADFVDESFKSFTPTPRPQQEPETSEGGFEIDADMLEVFRDEADSLLKIIRQNLETLSQRPDSEEALWEMKRSAHTLKGAAGVVGQNRLSALAHRLEDLLNRLSETEGRSNTRIFELLENATSCLTLLADGEASSDLDSRMESLEQDFAAALRSMNGSVAADHHEPQIETAKPDAHVHAKDEAALQLRKETIVRVSLERIDDLVGIVRGLEMTRSAFEKHIEELERQLEESYNNRLRLQAASGKIQKLEGAQSGTAGDNKRSESEFEQITYELAETSRDASVINTSLGTISAGFEDLYGHQRELIEKIQQRLLRLRNVEFGTIATRLQRTVRVTCDEEGKKAEVEIENSSLEVDTQIIDCLIEPLMHLLKNAVVHGIESPDTRRMLGKDETGKISIAAGNDGPCFILTVTDDGRGIAQQPLLDKAIESGRLTREAADRMTNAQIRELIFLPGLTTAERLNLNAGRGVGMSIIQESLAAAGGTIEIETWPQRGTTFTVRLPNPFAAAQARERLSSRKSGSGDPDQLSILVVDDSPSVRLMTTRTIESAGWTAQSAKNGLDALEKLSAMPELPHMILSDIEMPLMGGYEFVAAVRTDPVLREIPIVIISSRSGGEDRKQALAAGAIDYLTKPYNERNLIELIERFAVRREVLR